jgi:protein-S-isoprenylcysteine O-methyltransferase Ste14
MSVPKRNKLHSWSFVAVQGFILILLIFTSSGFGPSSFSSNTIGRVLQLAGWVAIIVSAFNIRSVLTVEPLPRENGKLSTHGLYKYVRHPMYSGVLILSLGIAVTSGSLFKYLLVIFLLVLFFYKSSYEEKFLRAQYPEYEKYAKKTPRLFPFIIRR